MNTKVRVGAIVKVFLVLGLWALTAAVLLPALVRTGPRRITSCPNNMKQLGIVCEMFVNENKGDYPRISPEAGHLTFAAGKDPDTGEISVFPEFLTDLHVILCPSSRAAARFHKIDGADQIMLDDWSYFYLGHVVTNDADVQTFAEAYRAAIENKTSLSGDLPTATGKGTFGGDRILRLRGHSKTSPVGSRYAVFTADPPEAEKIASSIPILIERTGNHEVKGGNVLYMDGRVEFLKYPGVWPMTEATIQTLIELSAMKESKS